MIYLDIPILDSGAKNIKLNGDIELVQKSPIISTTITSQLYNYENPFYDIDTKLNSPSSSYILCMVSSVKNSEFTVKDEAKDKNNKHILIDWELYLSFG